MAAASTSLNVDRHAATIDVLDAAESVDVGTATSSATGVEVAMAAVPRDGPHTSVGETARRGSSRGATAQLICQPLTRPRVHHGPWRLEGQLFT